MFKNTVENKGHFRMENPVSKSTLSGHPGLVLDPWPTLLLASDLHGISDLLCSGLGFVGSR